MVLMNVLKDLLIDLVKLMTRILNEKLLIALDFLRLLIGTLIVLMMLIESLIVLRLLIASLIVELLILAVW